jgi:hypothetical protein
MKNIILYIILYGSEICLIVDEELEYVRLKAGRVNCWGEYFCPVKVTEEE